LLEDQVEADFVAVVLGLHVVAEGLLDGLKGIARLTGALFTSSMQPPVRLHSLSAAESGPTAPSSGAVSIPGGSSCNELKTKKSDPPAMTSPPHARELPPELSQ